MKLLKLIFVTLLKVKFVKHSNKVCETIKAKVCQNIETKVFETVKNKFYETIETKVVKQFKCKYNNVIV